MLYKKFSTNKNYYIYDTVTNEILQVDTVIYDIFDDVLNKNINTVMNTWSPKFNEGEIIAAVDDINRHIDKGYFRINTKIEMVSPACCEDCLEHSIKSKPGHLALNITHDCNLRCKYCIYSGTYKYYRIHNKNTMELSTAIGAVNSFFKAQNLEMEHYVSFYGGEPLLKYDLIKEVIRYIETVWNDAKIRYKISTNGTLLTEAIIDYCIKKRVLLQVSLDGPKHIHDRYRVFCNGRGSYKRVYKNLESIYIRNPNYYRENIMYACTLVPPYDLEGVNEYFQNENIFRGINVRYNLMDGNDTCFYNKYLGNITYVKEFSKQRAILKKKYIMSSINEEKPSRLEISFFTNPIINIHRRKEEKLNGRIQANGICIPGGRRYFVDVDGSIYPCEKVGKAFKVGHANGGLDKHVVFNTMNNYTRYSIEDCKSCWAMRLCRLCFASTVKNDKFDMDRKRMNCKIQINSIAEGLVSYASILEENNSALDFINDIDIQ